jgi:hypothetical protein
MGFQRKADMIIFHNRCEDQRYVHEDIAIIFIINGPGKVFAYVLKSCTALLHYIFVTL